MKDFELLPHTADIKIRVYGTTLKELFAHAVEGMFQCIQPKVQGCVMIHDRVVCEILPIVRTFTIESSELDFLLIDFLSHCLYLSAVHKEAYLKAKIESITSTHVHAEVYGVKVHGFEVVEIKAVTYHDTHVEEKNGIWQADIVFDI